MAEYQQEVRTNLRMKHVQQLVKTEMCKFFLSNSCRKGSRCDFAHSLQEIRDKPDLNCTSMCKQFLQTGNCLDINCRFAHDERDLRTTPGFFKTKFCKFASTGRCKHGAACRFAHFPEELSVRPTSGGSSVAESFQSISMGGMGNGISEGGGSSAADSFNASQVQMYGGWMQEAADMGFPPENSGRPGGVLQQQPQSQSMASGDSTAEGTSDRGMPVSSDQNGQEVGSEESTRGGTSVSVPTPNGSGESAQEESNDGSKRARENRSRGDMQRSVLRPGDRGRHCTTMMLTNVPNFLTQGALVSLFEDLTICFRGAFDFFYCPWDPYQDRNLGYAIINFFTRSAAAEFERQWVNQPLLPRTAGAKRLRIMPAVLQGRAAHVRHFSGFSLAHHKDPRFRPLIRAAPDEPLQPMALPQELGCNADDNTRRVGGQGSPTDPLMPSFPKEAVYPLPQPPSRQQQQPQPPPQQFQQLPQQQQQPQWQPPMQQQPQWQHDQQQQQQHQWQHEQQQHEQLQQWQQQQQQPQWQPPPQQRQVPPQQASGKPRQTAQRQEPRRSRQDRELLQRLQNSWDSANSREEDMPAPQLPQGQPWRRLLQDSKEDLRSFMKATLQQQLQVSIQQQQQMQGPQQQMQAHQQQQQQQMRAPAQQPQCQPHRQPQQQQKKESLMQSSSSARSSNGQWADITDAGQGNVFYMFVQPGVTELGAQAEGLQGLQNMQGVQGVPAAQSAADEAFQQQCWGMWVAQGGNGAGAEAGGVGDPGPGDAANGSGGMTPAPYLCNQLSPNAPFATGACPVGMDLGMEDRQDNLLLP